MIQSHKNRVIYIWKTSSLQVWTGEGGSKWVCPSEWVSKRMSKWVRLSASESMNELVTQCVFTLGSIARSEPELDSFPLLLTLPDCVHIILFGSAPHQASSCLPRCLVTAAQQKMEKCIRLRCTFINWRFDILFVLYPKLQYITTLTSILWMYC